MSEVVHKSWRMELIRRKKLVEVGTVGRGGCCVKVASVNVPMRIFSEYTEVDIPENIKNCIATHEESEWLLVLFFSGKRIFSLLP